MGPGRPPGGGWCGPVVVRACPDPALCPGPGVPGCPTAVALHRLRDAPITAAVVRAVAGLDPVLLAGPEQADLLRILHRVSTWALTRASDCALTVAHASAADDSAGDAVVDPVLLGLAAREVAIATHVSPGSARWRLSTHTDLAGRAPGLLTALRAGDSSPQHARLLAEETEGLDDPAARWVATQVHPVLLAGTRAQLRRALRRTIAAWHAAHPPEPEPDQPADPDPDSEEADAAEGADAAVGAGGDDGSPRAGRRVELEPLADGMAWIHALLPAEDTAALWTRLDAAVPNSGSVHNPDRPDRPDRPGGPDPRTPDQIRADTLAAWGWHGHPDPPDRALTPLPAGRVLGRVHVTLNLATLLGLREDPAALGLAAPGHPGHDLGPITPAAARRIAADADWQRFLHDPTGTLSGVSTHYPRRGPPPPDRPLRHLHRLRQHPPRRLRRPRPRHPLDPPQPAGADPPREPPPRRPRPAQRQNPPRLARHHQPRPHRHLDQPAGADHHHPAHRLHPHRHPRRPRHHRESPTSTDRTSSIRGPTDTHHPARAATAVLTVT